MRVRLVIIISEALVCLFNTLSLVHSEGAHFTKRMAASLRILSLIERELFQVKEKGRKPTSTQYFFILAIYFEIQTSLPVLFKMNLEERLLRQDPMPASV